MRCIVLIGSDFLFAFRHGEASSSTPSSLDAILLLLFGCTVPQLDGESTPEDGVTMHSSDPEERLQSASKTVGLGDGHQPLGLVASWSRIGRVWAGYHFP